MLKKYYKIRYKEILLISIDKEPSAQAHLGISCTLDISFSGFAGAFFIRLWLSRNKLPSQD